MWRRVDMLFTVGSEGRIATSVCGRVLLFFIRPWRWRRYVPPKRRLTQYLHGTTSQKTAFLTKNLFHNFDIRTRAYFLERPWRPCFTNYFHVRQIDRIWLKACTFPSFIDSLCPPSLPLDSFLDRCLVVVFVSSSLFSVILSSTTLSYLSTAKVYGHFPPLFCNWFYIPSFISLHSRILSMFNSVYMDSGHLLRNFIFLRLIILDLTFILLVIYCNDDVSVEGSILLSLLVGTCMSVFTEHDNSVLLHSPSPPKCCKGKLTSGSQHRVMNGHRWLKTRLHILSSQTRR
jgi:hypothetical protein